MKEFKDALGHAQHVYGLFAPGSGSVIGNLFYDKFLVYICQNNEEIRIQKKLCDFVSSNNVIALQENNNTTSKYGSSNIEQLIQLSKLKKQNQNGVLLTTFKNLIAKYVDIDNSTKYLNPLNILINNDYDLSEISKKLIKFGYDKVYNVRRPGEFAIRGYILDISLDFDNSYRLEFFGNTLEHIRLLDLLDQQSKTSKLDKIILYPIVVQDTLSKNIFDYLPKNYIVLLPQRYIDTTTKLLKNIYEDVQDISPFFMSKEEIKNTWVKRLFIGLSLGHNQKITVKKYSKQYTKKQIEKELANNKKYVLTVDNKFNKQAVIKLLNQYDLHHKQITLIRQIGKNNIMNILSLHIEASFEVNDIIFIATHDIIKDSITTKVLSKTVQFNEELEINDFVIHEKYGIARYKGVIVMTLSNVTYDFFKLEYSKGDILYIPLYNLDLVKLYERKNTIVQLDSLNSKRWFNRYKKVKKDLLIMAKQLMSFEAKRALIKVQKVYLEGEIYDNFVAQFEHLETDDQLRSIKDIRHDLASGHPVDRLLLGDTGFGKTEVIMRAAFIVAMQAKQVIVIVPSTLLALQHYKTFSHRMRDFPIKISFLSRLVSLKQRTKIIKELKKGTIDIIIGTHALLHSSIDYKDPFLVIIDEEHHFGVKQKEMIKALKSSLHVLSVSATPIPRTFQLTMSGFKKISVLSSPPFNRQLVRIYITAFEKKIISEAITNEINRGGQIFFIVPRISFIAEIKQFLDDNLTEVKYETVHGKMQASVMEKHIENFIQAKKEVLISTNIVEAGVDMPRVNTIIIYKANLFGLASLYQLKGRVGRADKTAFCYLTYLPEDNLSQNAVERLDIIDTLNHFGSGIELANYDLSTRGAGNVLGSQQSGHIKNVGIGLYTKILKEAILIAKNPSNEKMQLKEDFIVSLNLDIQAFIPKSYIKNPQDRLYFYNKLNNYSENLTDVLAEIIDRYGKTPNEIKNLIQLFEIKKLCIKLGIEKLSAGLRGISLSFYKNYFKKGKELFELISKNVFIQLKKDMSVFIKISVKNEAEILHTLKIFLQKLENL